jgi:tRNA1(Val) A37 N6-methylase TrmN6
MSCCSSIDSGAERQFGERRATQDLANYRAKGPGSTARLLLAGIAKVGQPRGRLLDIGSGVGALTFELLDRGLTEAIGVDLSSAHVAAASKEAARRPKLTLRDSSTVILSTLPLTFLSPISSP